MLSAWAAAKVSRRVRVTMGVPRLLVPPPPPPPLPPPSPLPLPEGDARGEEAARPGKAGGGVLVSMTMAAQQAMSVRGTREVERGEEATPTSTVGTERE